MTVTPDNTLEIAECLTLLDTLEYLIQNNLKNPDGKSSHRSKYGWAVTYRESLVT